MSPFIVRKIPNAKLNFDFLDYGRRAPGNENPIQTWGPRRYDAGRSKAAARLAVAGGRWIQREIDAKAKREAAQAAGSRPKGEHVDSVSLSD